MVSCVVRMLMRAGRAGFRTTFIFAAAAGSGIPRAFCWSRSRGGPAANREPHGQNPPTIMADGIKPRFLRTMFLVWNDHTVGIFENPQDRGKIHAVLCQTGDLLGRVELQPHVAHVCRMASSVKTAPPSVFAVPP